MNSKRLRTWLFTLLATLLLLGSTVEQAQAYDIDTHFYATYAMARYAGINHAVASRIALGGEWFDEHIVSSPMIPTVFIGTKIRKCAHFAGYSKAADMASYQLWGLNGVTKTIAMHDFSTEMLTRGLKEGDFFKAVQSFHTMQDSFAHTGTTALAGHSYGGHWPDRPFWRNYNFYGRMVHASFQMLVAIRGLLPREALDLELRPTPQLSQRRNYLLSADELSQTYLGLPEVQHFATTNVLTHPDYVKFAVEFLVRKAEESHYFNPQENLESWLIDTEKSGEYRKGLTGQQVLERLMSRMVLWETQVNKDTDTSERCTSGRRILQRQVISQNVGIRLCDHVWLRQHGGSAKVISELVGYLTQGYLPVLPNPETSLVEVEDEGPIRQKEMEIRIGNVKNLIFKFYGVNIDFKENKSIWKQAKSIFARDPQVKPTLAEAINRSLVSNAIAKEVFGDVKFNSSTSTVEIGPSDQDQDRFAVMMRKVFFPNLAKERTWGEQFSPLWKPNWGTLVGGQVLYGVFLEYLAKARLDLLTHNVVPGPENTYYRDLPTYEQYVKENKFKKLLSVESVKRMTVGSGQERRSGGILYESYEPNSLVR
ncbi:MAG: hypothetical protein AB7F59_06625 [Bdellovibrionales bacterium]